MSIPFDLIILDATFLCWRWVKPRSLFHQIQQNYLWIRDARAFKLALPQDDYDHAWDLDDWLADYNVDLVLTVCPKHWDLLYPRMSKRNVIELSFTGYIDEDDIRFYESCQRPFEARNIDVGYRVKRLPANFGHFGILKSEFGRRFKAAAEGRWKVDISDAPEDSLLGEDWPRFLGNCRFALGCESGSSVLDRRGEIGSRVEAYTAGHPDASFDEIAAKALKPGDEAHVFAMLSPRIFEITMAGCCPILIEGDYQGLLKPHAHYIPVARDFSNLNQVIAQMADIASARAMAESAREAVLGATQFRYSTWILELQTKIEQRIATRPADSMSDETIWKLILLHQKHVSDAARKNDASKLAAANSEIVSLNAALEENKIKINEFINTVNYKSLLRLAIAKLRG